MKFCHFFSFFFESILCNSLSLGLLLKQIYQLIKRWPELVGQVDIKNIFLPHRWSGRSSNSSNAVIHIVCFFKKALNDYRHNESMARRQSSFILVSLSAVLAVEKLKRICERTSAWGWYSDKSLDGIYFAVLYSPFGDST